MASSLETNKEDSTSENGSRNEAATAKRLRWAADVVVENNTKTTPQNNDSKDETNNNNNNNGNISNSSKKSAAATDAVTDAEAAKQPPAAAAKAPLCSFCRQQPACVVLKKTRPGSNGKRRPLCLLHYYTTSAVHVDAQYVKILDSDLVEAQMKGGGKKTNTLNMQELFAEAFVQLQQELAQESLTIDGNATGNGNANPRKTQRPDNDPLSILHDLGRSKKRRQAPPPPPGNHSQLNHKPQSEGGFLKPVPIPERLRRTQQQQAKIQAEQVARMNRAPSLKPPPVDTSKRRKRTGKSVWDAVIKESQENPRPSKKAATTRQVVPNNVLYEGNVAVTDVKCSCGSTNVSSAGNITSRNQDVAKADTWGMKDRVDDIVLRYRCNQCGKCWQESG